MQNNIDIFLVKDYLSEKYVKQHLLSSVNDIRELIYHGDVSASLTTFLNELEERIREEFNY